MSKFILVLTFVFQVYILVNSCRAEKMEPVIWFAPLDPIVRQFNGTVGPKDYFDLFAPDRHWTGTLEHVKVFKIYPQIINFADYADLKRVFSSLRDNHISLALEYGALTDSAICGRGVEGFNGAALETAAARIQSLGGTLDYLAMDEPLWYGHEYKGPQTCGASIEEVARDAVKNVATVRRYFPAVKIGDIEPVAQSGMPPEWRDVVLAWCKIFGELNGKPLDFLQLDVGWNGLWRDEACGLKRELESVNVAVGVIFNGGSDDVDSDAWVHHSLQHAYEFEAHCQSVSQAVFQSWTSLPTRVLPDTELGTMTNLLRRYIARKE